MICWTRRAVGRAGRRSRFSHPGQVEKCCEVWVSLRRMLSEVTGMSKEPYKAFVYETGCNNRKQSALFYSTADFKLILTCGIQLSPSLSEDLLKTF